MSVSQMAGGSASKEAQGAVRTSGGRKMVRKVDVIKKAQLNNE